MLLKRKLVSFVFTTLLAGTAGAVQVGSPAPDFSATDTYGKPEQLAAYKGKYVVLEWTNSDCPYTRKHYESGNMQALQKEWTAKGVIWLSVISSAPGQQGYKTAAEENSYLAREHAAPTGVLLDSSGTVGRTYEAKTTPHMFVIDPSGKLIYEGAIDDRPTTNSADIKVAKNYVSEALTNAMAGKPVKQAYTRAYGCGVKYAGE